MTCLSCGLTSFPRSKEHVFAVWLLEYLSAKDLKVGIFRLKADGCNTLYRQEISLNSFRLNRICENCNSGWMSKLEEQTKPIIKALITRSATLDSLDIEQRHLLARWAGKTAIVESHAVGAECPVDVKLLSWMRIHENGAPGRFGAVACSLNSDGIGHLQVGIITDLLGGERIAGSIVVVALPNLFLVCAFPLPDLAYNCRCDLSLFMPLWPDTASWRPMPNPALQLPESHAGPDILLTLAERVEIFHSLR